MDDSLIIPLGVGGACLSFQNGLRGRCNRWRHILPGRRRFGCGPYPVRGHIVAMVMHEHDGDDLVWNIWPVGAAKPKEKFCTPLHTKLKLVLVFL